jgi:hypothetical protein
VILNLARKEQAKVDILGLARAKRRIQEIVERSKADKKIRSRSRIARWKTGGKPVTRGEENDSPSLDETVPLLSPTSPETQPDSPSLGLDLSVDPDDLENEEWSAGYDLPNTSYSDSLR